MSNSPDQFIEKEVVLIIRVPADFDREDERMLDDEFAATLERQGWELVNSREYRDIPGQAMIPVNRVTVTRERYSENESWSDHFWVDASKTPGVDLFKAAIRAFLQTPPGKEAIEASCQDFNWGDAMMYIPSEIWNEHGIYPFDFHRTPQEMGLAPTTSDNLFSFTVEQDEILIPDPFSEREGEKEVILPAETLPEGWRWGHWPDGSGSLCSPEGKLFFAYDRSPYWNQRGIEYMETESAGWSVFWGTFENFKAHAEKTILQKLREQTLGTEHANPPSSLDDVVKAAETRSTTHTTANQSHYQEPDREHE